MTKPIDPRKASREVRAVLRRHQEDAQRARREQFLEVPRQRSGAAGAHLGKRQSDHGAGCARSALTKEMIYLAVSVTNGCEYCIASHTAAARKAGMSEAMFGELMAVVGMANETNRLADGYRVPVDAAFDK